LSNSKNDEKEQILKYKCMSMNSHFEGRLALSDNNSSWVNVSALSIM